MIELTSHPTGAEQEMVDLFSIDGTAYQIPRSPRVNVGLKYLRDVREYGENLAEMMLLERLLGEDGFAALSEYEGLTRDQMKAIRDIATRITLGAMEEAPDPESGR